MPKGAGQRSSECIALLVLALGCADAQMGELTDNAGCTGGCTTQGHIVSASPKAYAGSSSSGTCATHICGCDWAGSHSGSQTDVYFLSNGGSTSNSSDANILKRASGDSSKCSAACGTSTTCTCETRAASRPPNVVAPATSSTSTSRHLLGQRAPVHTFAHALNSSGPSD